MRWFPCHPYASGSKVPVLFWGKCVRRKRKGHRVFFSFYFRKHGQCESTRSQVSGQINMTLIIIRRYADWPIQQRAQTRSRSGKMKTNEWTLEQLLRRERPRSKRRRRKRGKPGTISIYLPRAPSIFLHNQRPCRTDDTGSEQALKDSGTIAEPGSPEEVSDNIITNRDSCVKGIPHTHTHTGRRNRISLHVVATDGNDRRYQTSMHRACLSEGMNMDGDNLNVWTWITHVCQNHTKTVSAYPPAPPLRLKKDRNHKLKGK